MLSDPTTDGLRDTEKRLALANRLFQEYFTRCFWHSPRDLVITEALIPFVVKGLRAHGGRDSFLPISICVSANSGKFCCAFTSVSRTTSDGSSLPRSRGSNCKRAISRKYSR